MNLLNQINAFIFFPPSMCLISSLLSNKKKSSSKYRFVLLDIENIVEDKINSKFKMSTIFSKFKMSTIFCTNFADTNILTALAVL